jgi:GTP cyclohydrolase III
MMTEAYLYDQKEWTEKTIRTREKLEKLQERIWKDLPNYHGKLSPMEIVSYMVDSVKVSEILGKITVTMLSPKGVEWCNEMWEKVE